MYKILFLLSFLLLIFFCSDKITQVHVNNQNDEMVNILIKSNTGSTKIINIDSIPGRSITPYIEISPTNGGIISASRIGIKPKDINFHAVMGNSYIITLSSGDNPILTWEKE